MASRAAHKLATAEDLAARAEDKGWEVIRGVIVHKAAPSFEHGDAQSAICAQLKDPFQRGRGGPGGWWIGTEVEVELEIHEVYLPDVAGWRRERVPERPKGRPIRIRPDWVAEVLSKSTAENDLGPKFLSYHRAGVQRYWLVDPFTETLTVFRWSSDGYDEVLIAGRHERVRAAPFEAVELHVGALFGVE